MDLREREVTREAVPAAISSSFPAGIGGDIEGQLASPEDAQFKTLSLTRELSELTIQIRNRVRSVDGCCISSAYSMSLIIYS